MQLNDTFAALGNGVRLAIVERLLREGELAAGDLVAEG
jgi:DNA-binding transcriptional ArsR family regulator